MFEKVDLVNPEQLPLGKLQYYIKKDGVQIKVPALSNQWVEKRCYTKYKPLPIVLGKLEENLAIKEWLSEAEYFDKDMEYLLQLPHFRFWSNIVFDQQCMEAIISFFQEATPCYINIRSLTKDKKVLSTYQSILNNACRVVCRMITNKESEEEWIAKEHLQELLYSKFLISIPLIFDIIIAYGRSNITLLSKVITTVFKIEEKYTNDLKLSLQFFQTTLQTIQKKAESENFDDENNSGINTLDDLAAYTLDCALTISILLDILPQAKILCNNIKMSQSISNFYDNAIPLLYKNICTIDPNSMSLMILNKARIELLKSFRLILYLNIENILKDPDNSIYPSENYIGILTECLVDRTFVIDYQNYFPVESDIDILKQTSNGIDEYKIDFVLKAYTSEGEAYLLEMMQNDINNEPIIDNDSKLAESGSKTKVDSVNQDKDRNICEEINAIKEVFPDLGDGFIHRLLPRYSNSEQAIAALLEGNLPPDLETADKSEIYIPQDPQDTLFLQTGIKRYNVFDGDQYDVMTQDNPNCIIKTSKGFPGQPKNIKQLLDDKSHVNALKERYQEYSLINDDNEYDDEYDDSYEAMADSESKSIKNRVGKDQLVDEPDDETEEEEESNDSDENNNNYQSKRDTTKDFCENPEVIRARYEAKRAAKYGGGGGGTSNYSKDVVGKAKGQGQDEKTLHNRQKKETHKSSRANHNRKSGASWKRSRGMIPS